MMKKTFTFIGFLSILLLSLATVSAYDQTKFNVQVEVTTNLPNPIALGTDNNMTITVINNNGTAIDLKWVDVVGSSGTLWTVLPTDVTLADGDTGVYTATLSVPADFALSTTRNLKLNIHEAGIATEFATFQPSSSLISSLYVEPLAAPTITATLDSEAKIGEEVTITASITNNDITGDFTTSLSDISSWAESITITPSTTSIDKDATENITIKFTPTSAGSKSFDINVLMDGETYSQPVSINIETSSPPTTTALTCSAGTVGTLKISDFEINNLGKGEDEEWELLDEIEITVDIENTDNDNDVKDVMVEIQILNNIGEDVTNDFDFTDKEIDLGKINNDEEERATFTIDELPADLDDGDYRIYIKAYQDNDEEIHCVSQSNQLSDTTYQSIDIVRDEDPAVIIKENFQQISASCGSKGVQATFSVYNLGSDKEEKILVTLYNHELGIDKKFVINDLKSGKRKEVTLMFDVPEELPNSYYDLDVMTYFDYDEDEDELNILSYDENSDDTLDDDYVVKLEVLSCTAPKPTITASLDSDSEVGKELIITATIQNTGKDGNFVISASGYESWAELISIEPQALSINENGVGTVIIKLNPTKEGIQTFKINSIVDGQLTEQQVSVNIAKKTGLFGPLEGALLYVTIAIIVILVLIFVTLIVKLSQRPKSSQF